MFFSCCIEEDLGECGQAMKLITHRLIVPGLRNHLRGQLYLYPRAVFPKTSLLAGPFWFRKNYNGSSRTLLI